MPVKPAWLSALSGLSLRTQRLEVVKCEAGEGQRSTRIPTCREFIFEKNCQQRYLRPAVYNSAGITSWRPHVASHPREVQRSFPEASLRQPRHPHARWPPASHASVVRLRRRTRHLQFRPGKTEG